LSGSDPRFSLSRVEAALRGRTQRRIEGVERAAAVAVVLREGPRGLETLFMKRADHPDDPWSGHVSFPGGRAEPDDPSLAHTAVRETGEELGLALDPVGEYIGPLDEVRATARAKIVDMKIAPFVFSIGATERPLLLNYEVASTHWVPLVELFDPGRASAVSFEREGQAFRFPSIDVSGITIWGLTLRMLRNFETLTASR
jgi:8-oxo-dGTP pyrophosphatase MutT (NUDIX family)